MAGIRPDKITVSDVKSRLLNIAQTSLYRLTIPVPADVSSFASQRGIAPFDVDNISLLCSEANLPGSSLATHDANNDYHGVSEKMVYRRLYDETADMTFYVDRNYKVVEFFETWIDYITGVGDVFTRTQFESPYVHHRMAYANDYKVNFYLTKFERDHHVPKNQTTLDYTFVYGFPININSMAVSYEQSQLLKCNVSFSFIRYVMKRNRSSQQYSYLDTRAPSVPDLQTFQPNVDLYKNSNIFDNFPNSYFDANKLSKTISNEYYLNFGQNSQDATNTANFFGAA
jgi:hypothetical protein